jgi:hypothetical protein
MEIKVGEKVKRKEQICCSESEQEPRVQIEQMVPAQGHRGTNPDEQEQIKQHPQENRIQPEMKQAKNGRHKKGNPWMWQAGEEGRVPGAERWRRTRLQQWQEQERQEGRTASRWRAVALFVWLRLPLSAKLSRKRGSSGRVL